MEELDQIRKNQMKLIKLVTDINNKFNALLKQEYHVPEVAVELNISDGSVYKISPNKLPFFKRGKFRVYKKEDVLLYKKHQENTSEAA